MGGRAPSRARRAVLLAAPPLLLASTRLAYRGLIARFGTRWVYLGGFLFYWFVWCLLLPLWVLGPRGLRDLFRPARPRPPAPSKVSAATLVLPPLVGAVAALPDSLRAANLPIVLTSIPYSVVNAACEEILWRGTYLAVFPGRPLLGYIYPSLGFAFWHLAPLSVRPSRSPGGAAAFVGVGLLFGLLWGWVPWKTGSIRWSTVSHAALDFTGLGTRVYFYG